MCVCVYLSGTCFPLLYSWATLTGGFFSFFRRIKDTFPLRWPGLACHLLAGVSHDSPLSLPIILLEYSTTLSSTRSVLWAQTPPLIHLQMDLHFPYHTHSLTHTHTLSSHCNYSSWQAIHQFSTRALCSETHCYTPLPPDTACRDIVAYSRQKPLGVCAAIICHIYRWFSYHYCVLCCAIWDLYCNQ